MELKRLVQSFAYRIEPKPEGGFIARPADPTSPALEAPTREELQQKIQAKLLAELGENFPGLKLPAGGNRQVKWEVHIESKPGGGFSVHSDQPGAAALSTATSEKIDHFAEELLGFVDKKFPQLSQAITAEAASRDIQVFTSKGEMRNSAGAPVQCGTEVTQTSDGKVRDMKLDGTPLDSRVLNSAAFSNTPITPETSSSAKFFFFVVTSLIIAAVMYFFYLRS
jgi:hypothetical protein